jgi:hypothetical protein
VADEDTLAFSDSFDSEHEVGDIPGNRAYFGRNVIRGLVGGIDDYVHERQDRWRRRGRWSMGPGLVGTAMWIDDDELIDTIASLSGACVVVTKQPLTKRRRERLARLAAVNERTDGLRINAFPYLSGLAPKVDGKPQIVGPYDPMGEDSVPTFRTLGFRSSGKSLVPIMHAKLAVVGEFWWFDEAEPYGVGDVFGFAPARLWISSANFTRSSRSSLEFGYWTEDEKLLDAAYHFIMQAIRSSEPLDAAADVPDPEFVPVDFDEAAMIEAISDMDFGAFDPDE